MNREKLTELVYINLGRASMCWSEIPKGVFDSTKAAELGKEIMDAVEKYIEEAKEPGWNNPLVDYLDWEEKYNKESEWQRRRRLEVMKEAKMNPNPNHYASRDITVEEIHQVHKEIADREEEQLIERIVTKNDIVGVDGNNPMLRLDGIYYTLDPSFKKILKREIHRGGHWWWDALEPK